LRPFESIGSHGRGDSLHVQNVVVRGLDLFGIAIARTVGAFGKPSFATGKQTSRRSACMKSTRRLPTRKREASSDNYDKTLP
jgi:hypothetical protein